MLIAILHRIQVGCAWLQVFLPGSISAWSVSMQRAARPLGAVPHVQTGVCTVQAFPRCEYWGSLASFFGSMARS